MTAHPITEPARAKVNLSLIVHGRLASGYHALESLVVFAKIGDELTAEPAGDLSLKLTGPYGAGLEAEGDDNLVLKAARAFKQQAGASLMLKKNLPVASGLGGGSADAAAALRALRALWRIDISDGQLAELAARLGADVPVCLASRPAMMSGIGEVLSPLTKLPEFWLVLANPGLPVPTAPVFKALAAAPIEASPAPPPAPAFENIAALTAWLADRPNHLEAAARALVPQISEVIAALDQTPGCELARMSGSGASCFGIYGTQAKARSAAAELKQAHKQWWVEAALVEGV